MKPLYLSLFVFLFSLKSTAQCPVYLSDDTAVFQDETCGWVIDEISECEEIEMKYPLSIFPNPTTDFFEVRNYENTEGYIFDLQGRLIRRIDVSAIVDISDLPKSIYIIRVGLEIQKLIIQ